MSSDVLVIFDERIAVAEIRRELIEVGLDTLVLDTERREIVEIAGDTLLVEGVGTAGAQGVPGPQGPQGPPGSGSGSSAPEVFVQNAMPVVPVGQPYAWFQTGLGSGGEDFTLIFGVGPATP